MKRLLALILLTFLGAEPSLALEIESDAVFVRIIDVGAGHSAVVRMPGNHYMVYDAGDYRDDGTSAIEGIREVVPESEDIDLLVLSHSDADHLGAVDKLFDAYTIKKVLRSGYKRTTARWRDADEAIRSAKDDHKTLDINLRYFEFPAGATYRFGDTFVTMVAGFHKPPSDWDIKNKSEERNAGSIIIRVQFKGKSILFTGDAVGRHIDDPPDAVIAIEKFVIENSAVIPIDSDVLVAPHHGADNGGSTAFIKAVSPNWVIFPSGHAHKHPRAVAAERYLDNGVAKQNMFRTDLGDDEGVKEWGHGRVNNHKDGRRDDDVDILIRPSGEILVEYRHDQ